MFAARMRVIDFSNTRPRYYNVIYAPALCLLLMISAASHATDNDSDGIDDTVDNCSAVSDVDQRDTDNDGIGNSWVSWRKRDKPKMRFGTPGIKPG